MAAALKKIDRYEVLDELGHGGMATVYRARDTKLDRLIALKVMHPHLRGAKEARARFRREAQSVARLGHPKILEIYDYSGEDSEESYIASQLLTGPTLRVWADQHAPVPAEIAACIGIEIASALGAAHDKGIVHRDVKPENILLHENQKLVLTDFGIADMVDSQSMTATGQILGSPGHMAPEQIEGESTDARTDVFALGTVLYFLCTGRLPFTGRNPHQILKRIVDGEYPDPLRLEPRVGARMRKILAKALEKKPEDRYPSAKALEAALLGFVQAIGIEDPSAEVAAFFAGPEPAAKSVYDRVARRYTELGKAAKAAGDIPEAHDCFSRVLAIDDGNEEVLALLSRIGRTTETRGRGRQAATAAVAVVLLAGAALGIRYFADGDGGGDGASPVVSVDDGGPSDAGLRAGGPEDASGGSDDAPVDARTADGNAVDGGTVSGSTVDSGTVRSVDVAVRHVTPPRLPRRVDLVLDPANVSVSIDGAAPVSYVALASGISLSIGRHEIAVTSITDCCVDATYVIDVEPGDDVLEVRRRLVSHPAALSVRGTPRSLAVVVDGGRARGRGFSDPIFIPMGTDRRARLRVDASAPGYLPFSTEVDFEAGDDTAIEIALLPDPAAVPPP